MPTTFRWVLALVVLLMPEFGQPVAYSGVHASSSCSAPEYRQFDFWLGDWDVFDYAGPAAEVARVQVERLLDGCVVREQYADQESFRGQSLSIYDATRRVWHQTWVTNRGRLLVIEGSFRAGEMVLEGSDLAPDGRERHIRGTWKAVPGGVRETAVTSMDAGKTWQPWFDLMFRPHRR